MRAAGCPYRELERQGIGLPVRRLELRYRGSACFEDELAVETRVLGLRAASVRFGYRVRRVGAGIEPGAGDLIAEGEVELACVELADPTQASLRPRMLPGELRSLLEPLIEAP